MPVCIDMKFGHQTQPMAHMGAFECRGAFLPAAFGHLVDGYSRLPHPSVISVASVFHTFALAAQRLMKGQPNQIAVLSA
jgi:hypothetical protein